MTTNLTSLAYIVESTPGSIPSTPNFQELPVNSIGLIEDLIAQASEALRGDRMQDNAVVVDKNVAGDCTFELSYTAWLPILVALLQQGGTADASVDITATDLAANGTTDEFESTATNFVTSNVKVGQWIRVSGFTEAANNGMFRITSVATDAIGIDTTLNPTGLTTEVAGDSVTMKGDMYRNGASTPKTYTFRKILDKDGTKYYFYYTGVIISSVTINWAASGVITGTLNLQGRSVTVSTSPQAGEATTEAVSYDMMSAGGSVLGLYYSLDVTAVFTSLELSMNNNVNPKKGIATLGAVGHGSFDFDAMASGEFYFEDLTTYNAFNNSTGFLVSLVMDGGSSQRIVITMPNCKWLTLAEPIPGKNNFLMESGSFQAFRESTLNCSLQIDFVAT